MADKRTQKHIRRGCGRRGAGLEMAMLLMVVAVALSGLLTSTVIMQIDKKKDAEAQLEQRLVLEQIGRDFCVQRTQYDLLRDLPQGVTGNIVYKYKNGGVECPGCCENCSECDEIYTVPEGGEETNNTEETGSGESAEGAASRQGCCKDCDECETGCTGFTELSLEARLADGYTLTVVLENNDNGTYTVTEWSYGE